MRPLLSGVALRASVVLLAGSRTAGLLPLPGVRAPARTAVAATAGGAGLGAGQSCAGSLSPGVADADCACFCWDPLLHDSFPRACNRPAAPSMHMCHGQDKPDCPCFSADASSAGDVKQAAINQDALDEQAASMITPATA